MSERKSDLLSAHARAEIDHWLSRYPADQKQSAVLAALRECWPPCARRSTKTAAGSPRN